MPKKPTKKSRQTWVFFFRIILPVFVLVTLFSTGIFLRQFTEPDIYDSSLDGSEILEEQQTTIPQDVQEKLAMERKFLHVLGKQTQKTPYPIPVSVKVPIFLYHYVEYVQDPKDTIRMKLNTTPYTLDDEVKTLAQAGYTFLTAKDLSDVLDGKAKLPQKPILLTFDDGYRDFYTDAYPILKKYNAKATQYVIAGFLDRNNHLLTSQLQEIASDGLVEIGAHTVHHLWLKGQTQQVVTTEVSDSKRMLEEVIKKPVVSFAYPYGAFDLQALEAVQKAGLTSASATIPSIEQKPEERFFLHRLRPGGRTGLSLLTWLETQQ